MNRTHLSDFLRARRAALRPQDVGLPGGPRRRTVGLRREEVAVLAGMSADYYARIEQQRGPLPSEAVLASLARAFKLRDSERDHLFRLAGFSPPGPHHQSTSASESMVRVVDCLHETPAIVLSHLGETLLQTRSAIALLGDLRHSIGLSRYLVYRWFTDPHQRALFPASDHHARGRVFVTELRAAYSASPTGPAQDIVDALTSMSAEFRAIWGLHEVDITHHIGSKRYLHPVLGELDLFASRLVDPDEGQELLCYSATPGTVSATKLTQLVAAAQMTGPAEV